ncbi:hypothetical protein [Bacillus paranthracis]|nr:hypothetical protein [Bacillus paranthracis]
MKKIYKLINKVEEMLEEANEKADTYYSQVLATCKLNKIDIV